MSQGLRKKSVVLLSGGLDSSVNLYEAYQDSDVVLALTFHYGQRAALKEIESARKQTLKLNIPHKVIELSWFADFTKTSLVNTGVDLVKNVQIDNLKSSQESAKNVWVPNRNGIFLNIAAAYAEGLKADYVVPGFNIEEGTTFPDNTQEYLDALTSSFSFSTATGVKAFCYTTRLNKTQMVRRGRELKMDFSLLWPCYEAHTEICRTCESCLRYLRAMREA